MLDKISFVKRQLDAAISQLCETSWMFSKNPDKDFSRTRKLPFRRVINFLLSMEGGSLATEMLSHFGCSAKIASPSAFVQQRGKMDPSAMRSLFDLFVKKTDSNQSYKGYRLIAADGSDIQIPTNPNDADSYFSGVGGSAPYNLLHMDAMYDLQSHTYTDVTLIGQRKVNERDALCSMIDRSPRNMRLASFTE